MSSNINNPFQAILQQTDPMQAILQMNSKINLFPIGSRYYNLDTDVIENADGKKIAYVRRRFLPQGNKFALLQEHAVSDGDRLDNIAARYLGDPEQFWRICDANNAMNPFSLTKTVGRKLRITLPEGISGINYV